MIRDKTKVDDAVAAYIKDRMARECDDERGRAAAIAEETGFTTAHIANIRSGKGRAGQGFAVALAKVWGMTFEELEQAAGEWAAARVGDRWVEYDPRYPNLAEAVAILRREGRIDPTFLDEAIRTQLRSPTDLPTSMWMRFLELEANAARRERAAESPAGGAPRRLSPQGQAVSDQMRQARIDAGLTAPGGEPDDQVDESVPPR